MTVFCHLSRHNECIADLKKLNYQSAGVLGFLFLWCGSSISSLLTVPCLHLTRLLCGSVKPEYTGTSESDTSNNPTRLSIALYRFSGDLIFCGNIVRSGTAAVCAVKQRVLAENYITVVNRGKSHILAFILIPLSHLVLVEHYITINCFIIRR